MTRAKLRRAFGILSYGLGLDDHPGHGESRPSPQECESAPLPLPGEGIQCSPPCGFTGALLHTGFSHQYGSSLRKGSDGLISETQALGPQ